MARQNSFLLRIEKLQSSVTIADNMFTSHLVKSYLVK